MPTWIDSCIRIMALILMALFTTAAVVVFTSAAYFLIRDLKEEWQYTRRKGKRNEGKQERN